ncbi:MAG: alpha/beta fold hydrolase [Magnetococcales bacterium]|nr:alpha/beta fold hydrolase [Magnetococcales bacterium]
MARNHRWNRWNRWKRRLGLAWVGLMAGLGGSGAAQAEMAVLVHGYFSGVNAWMESGVTGALQGAGWRNGGILTVTPRGIQGGPLAHDEKERVFYSIDLPSEAPLMLQAEQLKNALDRLRQGRPGERVVLVGHSAGGVAARLMMVKNPTPPIHGLITIASPHLGTDKAEWASLAGSTPLALFAPLVGGDTLNRSQALYADLVRERPGALLYWLNRQPHPEARYLAIVRQEGIALAGDNTVPDWSQDLRNVASLREKALVARIAAGHGLEAVDGPLLVESLKTLLAPPPDPMV